MYEADVFRKIAKQVDERMPKEYSVRGMNMVPLLECANACGYTLDHQTDLSLQLGFDYCSVAFIIRMKGAARQKVVAEIAILPAQWLDRWPLWRLLNLHVPAGEKDWARYHYEVFIFWIARDCLKRRIANRSDASELMKIYDASSYTVRSKRLSEDALNETQTLYDAYTQAWEMWLNGWESPRLGTRKDPTIVLTQLQTQMMPTVAPMTDYQKMMEASLLIVEIHDGFMAEVERILRSLPPPVEIVK